ncbi:scm-related gene containing four mbt domains isoform 1-T3 [Glossina fuscipes fuscipes]
MYKMNPSELTMMWMNQYNPDRISLEEATSFFHPSSVDMTHQQTVDLNPVMSIVGGDFSGHAAAAAAAVAASSAAAAAALGVQPTTLLAANTNDIYGLAQMGGLHQQLLQQSAATVFQNYTAIEDDDGSSTVTGINNSLNDGNNRIQTQFITNHNLHQQQQQQQQQLVYDQMDNDGYEDGVANLTPKQEIINIDDFVMMTDSNSYDGAEFVHPAKSSGIDITQPNSIDEHDLLEPLSQEHKLLSEAAAAANRNLLMTAQTASASPSSAGGGSGNNSLRAQRKTRKIEPVNRPGLVLKTPIAYKGNIDPSVIPIQKDGMAVCERCGAIGVKHTFYTKSRRFCSMACARGELYSLVVNNKSTNQQHQHQRENMESLLNDQQLQSEQQQKQQSSDIELALRVAHIKNANYRFRITDQSKLTQVNGYDESGNNNTEISENVAEVNSGSSLANNGLESTTADDGSGLQLSANNQQAPKAVRMCRDVMPQEELPQIPKLERLPTPCPQLEKIISIRRRLYDPTHSFDWTQRLASKDFFAAPVTCFPHAPGYDVWDNLGIDMKVEVENTDCDQMEVIQPGQTPHSFWVATILNIYGYKALMRYEGFDDDSHDFWVNLCNAEVHSVGWCATRGKPLIPPRTIENKYKDWKEFLVSRLSGARTLPSSFYNKVNDSMQSRFRLGLNLECVDKDRISQVRLATVTKIVGKRLFLRYFDSDDGFWCHEDSPIIHPVGWATTVGHNLAAPQDYLERMLAGREAMIEVHEDDATIELFKMNFTFEEYYLDGKTNGFMEGMKLEAVDPLNLSSICAATVMAVLKFGYMMIRIDSYQPDATGSDWFCYHEKSPNIFPVGFCASNSIPLTPPNGYDINTFSWEIYLQETGSVPAGEHLFHREVPNHGFEMGMSLECADLMDPRLVCVATVARVVGRLLKIHFDGWTEEYDQWLDCESADIYPVGWCVLVNHKLEGPPMPTQAVAKTPSKPKTQKRRKKKSNSNPTATTALSTQAKLNVEQAAQAKSRTIALKTNPHLPKLSIKLELKPEHQNPAFYEDNSIGVNDDDDDVADNYEEDSNSVQSNQSSTAHLIDTSSSSASFIATHSGTTTSSSSTTLLVNPAAVNSEKVRKSNNRTSVKKSQSPAPPTVRRKANSYIANSSVSNSKYIPRVSDGGDTSASADHIGELMPDSWNVYDVSQFLRVNDCTAHCDTFSRNKIDGKRLLQLSKDEVITLLGMKVGPALKIYDLIQQLKCKANPSKSRMHKANKFL